MTMIPQILYGDFEAAKARFSAAEPSTVVIVGPPRSGTSMVAGVLRLMGVYLGECNPKNNEDPSFNARHSVESILQKIAQYNDAHPNLWGWKEPSTHKYFSDVKGAVRNPVFIIVYRNIVSSIKSKLKHTGEGDIDKLSRAYANQYLGISNMTAMKSGPVLRLSYDEAEANPLKLAAELSDLIYGKPLDPKLEKMVAEYCAPGSYKSVDEYQMT